MTRPAVSPSLARWLAPLATIALLVVTLAAPSATRMQTWPWALLMNALWLAPVALGLAGTIVASPLRLPNAAVSAGLIALFVFATASAAVSPFRSLSLTQTWPVLGGVALCFVLHHALAASHTARETRAGTIVALGGALVVLASALDWVRAVPVSGTSVRDAFPFGHSTYVAGFVVLVLPWFVQQAFAARRAGMRAGWLLVAMAGVLVLVATGSRGAALALVGLIGLFAITALGAAPWTQSRKLLALAGAAVVCVTVIGANSRLRGLVLHHAWGDTARESNLQRTAMLAAGVRLGRDRPLLGWGPGAVPLAYPRVRAQLDGGVDNVLQLHDAPVQLFATLGLAGMAAIALVFGGLVRAAARAVRQRPRSSSAFAALASLTGYALFSLTDHQFDLPAIAAIVAVNLAVLTSAGDSLSWQPGFRVRTLLAFGIVACVVAPGLALTRDLCARAAYDRALSAMGAGQDAAVLTALDAATALTPSDPFFQHQAADWLLRERAAQTNPARRAALARAAAARLEASLRTGVHEEFAHFNLAWLRLELGEPAAAARHFVAVARLVPDKGGVYFGLGLALDAAGRRDAAIRAFALEWIDDPRQLTSPAWEVPALAALRPAVRAEALDLLARLRNSVPRAAGAEQWMRWWLGEPATTPDPAQAFNATQRAFAAALPALAAGAPVQDTAPWAGLYRAWLRARAGDAHAFEALAPRDAAFAAALARRTARHRAGFQAFLTAGTEDEPALLRSFRRERTGYGVLALHPEGPLLADDYVVQENRVVTEFASDLFPPKGWLPGRFLLALLPDLHSSNGSAPGLSGDPAKTN